MRFWRCIRAEKVMCKRALFRVLVNIVASLAGVYVAPFGIDWLIGSLFFIAVLGNWVDGNLLVGRKMRARINGLPKQALI